MKTILEFSGGKDSLACLYLLEPRWHEILVLWLNTGAALPEVVRFMAQIRARVPHFLEVHGAQTIDTLGWPADVVPTRETPLGKLSTGQWPKDSPVLFQSRFECCAAAIWHPMDEAVRQIGAEVVIRGQKLCDPMRSPIVDGQVVEGIRYEFPLAHWTDPEVERYLTERGIATLAGFMPNSSLDCWNCTAYLDESGPKLQYLKRHHPEKYTTVQGVLRRLSKAVESESQVLISLLEPA